MLTNDGKKEWHQLAVETFMLRMKDSKQNQIPTKPTVPSLEVRKLRASLMLEECLETIRDGLGLDVMVGNAETKFNMSSSIILGSLRFEEARRPSLLQLADGLGDQHVVNEGTGSSFGIALAPIYRIVQPNNLSKFAPGHSYREDGKLIKPKDFTGPEFQLMEELIRQGADPEKDFGAWDKIKG